MGNEKLNFRQNIRPFTQAYFELNKSLTEFGKAFDALPRTRKLLLPGDEGERLYRTLTSKVRDMESSSSFAQSAQNLARGYEHHASCLSQHDLTGHDYKLKIAENAELAIVNGIVAITEFTELAAALVEGSDELLLFAKNAPISSEVSIDGFAQAAFDYAEARTSLRKVIYHTNRMFKARDEHHLSLCPKCLREQHCKNKQLN